MTQNLESEKTVEAYLRDRMRSLGGKAYKWVSPGNDGVPDRICVFPGGQKELVETKGKGGRLTPSQQKRFSELVRMGSRVWVLWSREQVDIFIDFIGGGNDRYAIYPSSVSSLLYRPPVD